MDHNTTFNAQYEKNALFKRKAASVTIGLLLWGIAAAIISLVLQIDLSSTNPAWDHSGRFIAYFFWCIPIVPIAVGLFLIVWIFYFKQIQYELTDKQLVLSRGKWSYRFSYKKITRAIVVAHNHIIDGVTVADIPSKRSYFIGSFHHLNYGLVMSFGTLADQYILITQSMKDSPKVLISPENSEEFIRELSLKLEANKGAL